MTSANGFLPAALATLLLVPPASAQVLIQAPGMTASLDRTMDCAAPASVTVEARQPEVFSGNSAELQGLLDAVHALLAFECPSLQEIQVQGLLKGLSEPVYHGSASQATEWALQARKTIRADTPTAPGPVQADGSATVTGTGPYQVAGLTTGMGVEQAQAAVAGTFGAAPEYDSALGLLSLSLQGCPLDAAEFRGQPPREGWKCLQAWFTDQRVAQLYRLELVQVIPNDGIQAVEQALLDRYGTPTLRESDASGVLRLGWGGTAGQAGDSHTGTGQVLDAQLRPRGKLLVTTITLSHAAPPVRPAPGPPKLTL